MSTRFRLLLLTAVALPLSLAAQDPAGEGRIYEAGEVETPPRVLNGADFQAALAASFPAELRDAGRGGVVQVSFVVGADGRVRDARVVSATEAALEAPSLAAAGLLRLAPASVGGRPVATRVELPIEWSAPPVEALASGAADPDLPVALDESMLDETAIVYRMRDEREGRPRLLNGEQFNGMLFRRMPDWESAAPRVFTVDLLVELDDRGRPTEVSLLRGSGQPRVDAAVLGAAPGLRFSPAVVNGRRVASTLYYQLSVEKPADSRLRERVTPPRHGSGIIPRRPPPPPPNPR